MLCSLGLLLFFADEVETGTPCPVCSSKIRLIKGKWGEFYGCTAYPVCKWTGHMDADGNLVSKEKKKAETTEHDCAGCGEGKMVKRGGRNGDFYGCSRYPKCKHTANIGENGEPVEKKKGKPKAKAKGTGRTCPKCNEHELVERNGRYGTFIACSGYPKCKFIEK
jgi:DNA topoisomerase-1